MRQNKVAQCTLNIDFHIISYPALKTDIEGIYKIGQTEPLAGQVFYILDRSAEEVLKENKDSIWAKLLEGVDSDCSNLDKALGKKIKNILKFYTDYGERKYALALMHTATQVMSFTPLITASYKKAIEVLENNAIKIFATNPQGRAEIKDLTAGTYYVCGIRKVNWETRVWNIRINLKPGKNGLLLDNRIWWKDKV